MTLALICLYLAYRAYRSEKPFWFFHRIDAEEPLRMRNIHAFNIKVSIMMLLFSMVFLIPTLLYLGSCIKENLYVVILCSSMTIAIFCTMIYWHHLYEKYKTNS